MKWFGFFLFGISQFCHASIVENNLRLDRALVAGSACAGAQMVVQDLSDASVKLGLENIFNMNLGRATIERKNCVIAVPFNLAENERLVVKNISIAREISLKSKTKLNLDFELFLAGGQGSHYQEKINGAADLENIVDSNLGLKTECGQSGILRINGSISVDNKKLKSGSILIGDLGIAVSVEACD